MIIGVGVDLVEVGRLKASRHGQRLLDRLFTEAEQADCEGAGRWQSLAGRLAAKEAVVKALGTGLRGMRWKEIEVRKDLLGKPGVRLSGSAAAAARAAGASQIYLSLSHTRHYAVAQVIAATGEEERP